MKAALENFSTIKSDTKIVILGDMFELGNESEKEHQFISNYCKKLDLKNTFLVGKLFQKTTTEFTKFKTFELLQEYLKNYPFKNQHILIKGSRGMALERVLEVID